VTSKAEVSWFKALWWIEEIRSPLRPPLMMTHVAASVSASNKQKQTASGGFSINRGCRIDQGHCASRVSIYPRYIIFPILRCFSWLQLCCLFECFFFLVFPSFCLLRKLNIVAWFLFIQLLLLIFGLRSALLFVPIY
jgi:hypothetical protein